MQAAICFFDDYWLDVKRGVKRRWFRPQQSGEYIDPEFQNGVYPSVHWCPEAGVYRLWYEVLPIMKVDALRYLALAESEDGRIWRPVRLAEPPDPMSVEHPYIVYSGNGGVHGTSVFRDPFDPDPSRRYKAAGMTRTYRDGIRPETLPVRLSVSPDGIHWQEGDIIHPFTSDALNALFYNPWDGRYQALLRAAYVDRRIFQVTGREPGNPYDWSEPRLAVHPDAGYDVPVQLYSMWAGWNDGLFLGQLMKYYVDLHDVDYSTMTGYQDSELMYSYDGYHWMHTTREPLVERSYPDEHGQCELVLTGMTTSGDGSRHILVGTGSRFYHSTNDIFEQLLEEYQAAAHKFFFFEIRRDGFTGLENCGQGGIITTKTVELLQADLNFNVSVPFGRARFALLQPDGTPLSGFSFDDCELYIGDEVAAVPRWKARRLEEAVGRRVRISVELSCGILYAIRATMRPSIRTPQRSFGDGMQIEAERRIIHTAQAT